MASKDAYQRLRKDLAAIKKEPPPYIDASPLENNILEWHYVILGPPDCPYEGGLYHGKLVFPPEYPFKPPSIYMITPNGRFATNTRICLSISDFHPQTWKPVYTVTSILNCILSFMLETTPTTGSVESSPAMRRSFAEKSWQTNLDNRTFREVFPALCNEIRSGKVLSLVPEATNSSAPRKPVANPASAAAAPAPKPPLTKKNSTADTRQPPPRQNGPASAAAAAPEAADAPRLNGAKGASAGDRPSPLVDLVKLVAVVFLVYILYHAFLGGETPPDQPV